MVRSLDIRTNLAEFLKSVDQARLDQIPQAMAWAINDAAADAKAGIEQEMQRVFDRPVPYTLNAVWRTYASKRNLEAALELKDKYGGSDALPGKVDKGTAAAAYLRPQIEGGTRRRKAMEGTLRAAGLLPPGWFAVPAREAPLDGHGNVPHGFVVRMLSDLRAFREGSGYRANRKSGRRSGRKAVNAFFAVRPGGPKQTRHLKPGIYWRLPNQMLVCVFVFVTAVQYRQRFDFYGTADRLASAAFPKHWPAAWAKALATDDRRNSGKASWRP